MDKKIDNSVKPEELADIDNVEIEPLADEDLDTVVGGFCSLWSCSNKPSVEAV